MMISPALDRELNCGSVTQNKKNLCPLCLKNGPEAEVYRINDNFMYIMAQANVPLGGYL